MAGTKSDICALQLEFIFMHLLLSHNKALILLLDIQCIAAAFPCEKHRLYLFWNISVGSFNLCNRLREDFIQCWGKQLPFHLQLVAFPGFSIDQQYSVLSAYVPVWILLGCGCFCQPSWLMLGTFQSASSAIFLSSSELILLLSDFT